MSYLKKSTNKKPATKTKVTIAIGKPMMGEPMEYGKMPKKAMVKGKKKC